jgi:hypothetical protein
MQIKDERGKIDEFSTKKTHPGESLQAVRGTAAIVMTKKSN